MDREPCIVGVADFPLQDRGRAAENNSELTIQKYCAEKALNQAGLKFSDVDGLAVAGMWGMPGPGMMQPNVLIEYLGIKDPKWLEGTNIGGSTFLLHVNHAYQAIKAGICDTVLILYGSLQKSNASRVLGDRPALYSNQFEVVSGLPLPVGGYALAAQRHMHTYGSTRETLAEIAVSTRAWATMNENAAFQTPLTIEEVLSSKPIASPLHRSDCCLVTDGGGAVVITTNEKAKYLSTRPIYIRGFGESNSHSSINYMPNMEHLEIAKESSKRAFNMSNLNTNDIDLTMIYDSFTITVLLTLEAIGFCNLGEGKDFVQNQRTAPGGDFALNTNGGGLSYCHPGMYGIFTIIESARQLWGLCGERQLDKPVNALCHGTGGVLSSSTTLILSKESN
jgi:acetyl-CoA acetyltransferase